MKAFYSDTFVLPLPETHRFPMAKYRLLRERLLADGLLGEADLQIPEPVTLDELRLAHTPEYVDAVIAGAVPADMQRRIGFPWSPMMVERSRRSAGATLAAARTALADSGGIAVNLAGGTHHAFADRGEGFCVFNDVAIAARALLGAGAITRAAVVDCDVHQGNGTASIFNGDPAVFTLSFHGDKNFPFRKEISDRDVAFPDGTGDADYLAALEQHVPEVLDAVKPDIVFYLAGADPYEGDRLGRLTLTIDGLLRRDRFVLTSCRGRRIPVAIAMSGGYANDVDAIVTIHTNTIRAALEVSSTSARLASVS